LQLRVNNTFSVLAKPTPLQRAKQQQLMVVTVIFPPQKQSVPHNPPGIFCPTLLYSLQALCIKIRYFFAAD